MDTMLATKLFSKFSPNNFDTIRNNKNIQSKTSFSEDLPDGSCFSRVLNVEPDINFSCESIIKKCEYIGSFPVTANDQNSRTEFVKTQLKQMRHTSRKKSVLLVISITGIKVCSIDGKTVLMAHALRRISFATCDSENRQFSFLAREPNGHCNLQYCHSFLAANTKAAEAVSACMGRAFRMAYAQQLHAAAPLQFGAAALQNRSPASPLLQSAAALLRDDTTWTDEDVPAATSTPRATPRPCWAKKLIGKTKHSDPLLSQAMELTSRTLSLATASESPKSNSRLSPINSSGASCSTSRNLDLNLWSSLGGCSSSDENNSPTDLNSCKQIVDKPSLSKNLEVVQESALDSSFNSDLIHLSGGSYINEAKSWEGASTLSASKFNGKMEELSCHKKRNTYHNNTLNTPTQIPTAPADEDNLLETSIDLSSKRSSRSSCDKSMPSSSSSSSDVTNMTENSDISNSKNKRINHTGNASSVTPPPPPERHDSLCCAISEEKELRLAPWFQAGIPREIALEVLEQEPVGSFMVRESTSKPGCFALSLRVPRDFHQSGIAHYLIMRTSRGYKIKGFTKEFGTLTALITHHSVMPELLPCPLSLSRYNPSFKKHDTDDMVDIDDDPDYNLLSDFRKMLADINV